MKTLGVIVLNEFLDQVAQMSLAEYHVLVQTLVLDGSHKSLRIRIALGLCAGIFTLFTPAALRIATNPSVNNGSRSWIKYFAPRRNPSTGSVRFGRPASSTPRMGRPLFRRSRPSGSSVQSRRTPCTEPLRMAQSFTLKKSQAYSVSQCILMNRFHVRFFSRSGAGSIPASFRMSATVLRPISIFNPVRSASRIFV